MKEWVVNTSREKRRPELSLSFSPGNHDCLKALYDPGVLSLESRDLDQALQNSASKRRRDFLCHPLPEATLFHKEMNDSGVKLSLFDTQTGSYCKLRQAVYHCLFTLLGLRRTGLRGTSVRLRRAVEHKSEEHEWSRQGRFTYLL